MRRTRTTRNLGCTLLVGAFLATACGSDSGLSVNDPWARPTAPGADNAAFYMEIRNSGDTETLAGAFSERCKQTEVHATTMSDGVMSMAPAPADALTISSGESLTLEPGGIHVMCMGISAPLIEGEIISVELQFSDSDPITVNAEVEQRTG